MTPFPAPDEPILSALNLINDLDTCFQTGFGRLADAEKAGLDALAAAFSGTPLESALSDAADGLRQGRFTEQNFSLIAAARTSLFGAVYDALLEKLDAALSIERKNAPEEVFDTPPLKIQSAVSQILTELAITGFSQVTGPMLESGRPTLEKLAEEPKLIRLSALMNGFIGEMSRVNPAAMEVIPLRRWADLWTRAMIMTLKAPDESKDEPETDKKSGTLFILGVDIPRHPEFVTLNFYGILETDGKSAFTTFSLSSHSVDSIVGPDIWLLFHDIPVLKECLAGGLALEIKEMPALENGILLWNDECAAKGDPYDLFEKAADLSRCERVKMPASERHPVHIAEFLSFEKCTFKDGKISAGELKLTVDARRLSTCGPLNAKVLKGFRKAAGILRYDEEWLFQPVAVEKTVKKKPAVIHNGLHCLGDTKSKKKKKADNVAILRERASRLLRK